MPACATQETIAAPPTVGNLFLPIPDTDFRAFLAEVDDVARFAPEIITAVEADLDLLEKVLAYNCCRTILVRQRRRDALERAA